MSESEKPTIEDAKAQLANTEKPEASKDGDYSSARRIVENALAEVEADNSKKSVVCNDMFVASVKKIREQSEAEFLEIKARYGAIKGLLASDLNKLAKLPKKPRSEGDSVGRESKADMLIALIRKEGEFWHGEDNECFCSYKVEHEPDEQGNPTGEHWETWNLRSKRFKQWANHRFYQVYGSTVGDSALSEAIDTLSGVALYEGEEHTANLRYAMHDDVIYIDLGSEHWEAVKIDYKGWMVLKSHECPVKFYRSDNMRPLPKPEDGGGVDLLWNHLNLQDTDKRLLVLAWLLEAMRPGTPYPLLEGGGQQGTAKSTFSKRLRSLIDPNEVNLRAAPRNVEDIFIGTQSNHVVCYENLSHLSKNMQNAFCIISTGGGFAGRKLYSTTDEEAFTAMRPTILNGIGEVVTRADLADRTVYVELSKIEQYIPEAELEQAWEKDYPKITGALYSLMATTLAQLPQVKIEKPPRMADFARLGEAMFLALGEDRFFTEVYQQNRSNVITRTIESSPVALAIIDLINDRNTMHRFDGTFKELLNDLSNYKPKFYDASAWPKSPKGLATILAEIAPALLIRGVAVEKDQKRKNDGFHIHLSRIESASNTKTSIEL